MNRRLWTALLIALLALFVAPVAGQSASLILRGASDFTLPITPPQTSGSSGPLPTSTCVFPENAEIGARELLVENGTTLNLNFQLPVASTGYAIQVLNSTQQPTQYFTIHEDGGQSVQGISFTAAGGSSGGVSIFFALQNSGNQVCVFGFLLLADQRGSPIFTLNAEGISNINLSPFPQQLDPRRNCYLNSGGPDGIVQGPTNILVPYGSSVTLTASANGTQQIYSASSPKFFEGVLNQDSNHTFQSATYTARPSMLFGTALELSLGSPVKCGFEVYFTPVSAPIAPAPAPPAAGRRKLLL